MKKSKIIGLTLLSSIILFSVINSAMAAPPSYVGVKMGDEFVWVPTLNLTNINATAIALIGEDNWTLAYDMLQELFKNETGMEFDFFEGAGLRAGIHNVTDEMTSSGIRYAGLWYNLDVAYSANNWTRVLNATDSSSPMSVLINPADINETTFMYVISGPPLFMPKGLDYGFIAEGISNYTDTNPYIAGNYSFAAKGNGLEVIIKGSYLDLLLNDSGAPFNITGMGDVVVTARWNNKGVFEYASISYGGLELANVQLISGAIPGFLIPIVLCTSVVTGVVLIKIIKKKKKIII